MSLHRLAATAENLLREPGEENFKFNLALLQACLETLESSGYKEEIQRHVEDAWKARTKTQDYGKPASARYRRAEIEFFCGAMVAMHALFPDRGEDRLSGLVPVTWVVNPMTGRNVVEVP